MITVIRYQLPWCKRDNLPCITGTGAKANRQDCPRACVCVWKQEKEELEKDVTYESYA